MSYSNAAILCARGTESSVFKFKSAEFPDQVNFNIGCIKIRRFVIRMCCSPLFCFEKLAAPRGCTVSTISRLYLIRWTVHSG